MSVKARDNKNRWRSKTVAFRVSPEEAAQLEIAVRLSGLSKQDYLIRRVLDKEVTINGNPRVYKALRNQFAAVLEELQQIAADGVAVTDELLSTIQLITTTMGGLKEDADV